MKQILCGLALCLTTFTSCIKDEPLNAECDIVSVQSEWLEAHKTLFRGEPIVKNNSVSFTLLDNVDRTALNPVFVLPEGAHITAVRWWKPMASRATSVCRRFIRSIRKTAIGISSTP